MPLPEGERYELPTCATGHNLDPVFVRRLLSPTSCECASTSPGRGGTNRDDETLETSNETHVDQPQPAPAKKTRIGAEAWNDGEKCGGINQWHAARRPCRRARRVDKGNSAGPVDLTASFYCVLRLVRSVFERAWSRQRALVLGLRRRRCSSPSSLSFLSSFFPSFCCLAPRLPLLLFAVLLLFPAAAAAAAAAAPASAYRRCCSCRRGLQPRPLPSSVRTDRSVG